jgi:hypothetical protein
MVELELVGLSEDGTRVVLADAAGEEFAVPLDDRLRTLVRSHRARPRELENSMESALRPRDIQARIRAGESPEAVAEIAQVPVERILSFAVPVIAEREHIADRAQRCAVRRKQADGPGRLLGDAVAERLRGADLHPEGCTWDAWRRDDGRWTVTVGYRDGDGPRTATFVYDPLNRYSVAEDDDGRWLVGERTSSRRGREKPSRRLAAVSSEYDALLFDADDAGDLTAVADALGDDSPADRHSGEVLQRAGQDDEPAPAAAPATAPTGQDDGVAPAATEEHALEPATAGDEPAAEPESEPGTEPAARTATGDEESRARPQRRSDKRSRRGRGRASVPSWDEIMFGQQQKG